MLRRTARPDRPRPRGTGYGWWRWNTWRPNPPEGQMAATAEGRRYCFHPYRMKIRWRKADDRHDREGRPADETIGSTEARRRWFELLHRAMSEGEMIRVRHTSSDEPVILVAESLWRTLEARSQPRRGASRVSPDP